ncbi:MAG: hypothetical protein PHF86_02200 [Candidatus Nanoarchaeia archaeon]|nr:hypothetical protein [Candidatus Nanoarchaeia archaeon]
MKLVKEAISFERGNNPMKNLGLGRKNLIEKWLNEMMIEDYNIKDDYTIDALKGNVIDLSFKNLFYFPEYIQFNKVDGHFFCNNNHLISLKGSPIFVGRDFDCSDNNLFSLEYCPLEVRWGLDCSKNPGKFIKENVLKYCKIEKNRIKC